MTNEIKKAIDNKITKLGFNGCLNFLIETQLNPNATLKLTETNYRRIIRSELVAEKWSDLNKLFLNWQVA